MAEIVAVLPVLPMRIDSAGRAVWLGPQWETYTGRPLAALLHEAWVDLISPEDRAEAARVWASPPESGLTRELEYRLLTADGTYRWVLTRATSQLDAETGKLAAWVGVSLDVQEQKERMQEAADGERRARVVAEVAQALAQHLSLDAVLEAATEALVGAFPGAGTGIWLHDPTRRRLILAFARGYSAEGRLAMADVSEDHSSTIAEAFRRRDAVVYNADDPRMPPTTRRLTTSESLTIASVAGAPLLVGGHVLGALSLVTRGQTLDDSWLGTLCAVGAQVAAAVERTTLYERERAIADRLQGALLPALENEAILKTTGLTVAHRYRSGTEGIAVGGDFYDVWPVAAPRVEESEAHKSTTKLAVVLGDVSGKGLEAAVQTSALRHAVQAYAHLDPKPAEVMARVSDLVIALDLLPRGFATMFFATIEAATGRVEYCSAGHESMLLHRAGGEILQLEATAPALGLLVQAETDAAWVELDPGGHLVLFTDGVTEARQPQTRHLLGVDGLVGLLAEVIAEHGAAQSAASLATHLLGRVEEYAGGHLEDDAALLVIMRPPHVGGT